MAAPESKHWSAPVNCVAGAAASHSSLESSGCSARGSRTVRHAARPLFQFRFAGRARTMDFHRRIFGKVPGGNAAGMCSNISIRLAAPSLTAPPSSPGCENFTFTFDGEQHIHDAVAAGKVCCSSPHMSATGKPPASCCRASKCPINVTGFDKEAPAIRAVLDRSAQQHFKLIPLTSAPTDAIQLVAAMRRGELVCMMGDRTHAAARRRAFHFWAAWPISHRRLRHGRDCWSAYRHRLQSPGTEWPLSLLRFSAGAAPSTASSTRRPSLRLRHAICRTPRRHRQTRSVPVV